MKEFDVVLLTDSRYVNPSKVDQYIENVLNEDGLVIDQFLDHPGVPK